jgi:hypothetical protein
MKTLCVGDEVKRQMARLSSRVACGLPHRRRIDQGLAVRAWPSPSVVSRRIALSQ